MQTDMTKLVAAFCNFAKASKTNKKLKTFLEGGIRHSSRQKLEKKMHH
jgi:hypothetical protein